MLTNKCKQALQYVVGNIQKEVRAQKEAGIKLDLFFAGMKKPLQRMFL